MVVKHFPVQVRSTYKSLANINKLRHARVFRKPRLAHYLRQRFHLDEEVFPSFSFGLQLSFKASLHAHSFSDLLIYLVF